MSTPFEYELLKRRVAARYMTARANYQAYVERKKREHEKPLTRDEWQARVEGAGQKSDPKPDHDAKNPHTEAKGGWREKLTNLSEKAKKFVSEAPKAVRSFVEDSDYRKKALAGAKETIRKLPEKVYDSARNAVKHEAHDFKEAAAGVRSVLRGEKMTDTQKHAVKAVAFEAALTVAVVAVSGGIGAGIKGVAVKTVDTFAHSVAKKIALNAVTRGLGNLVTLEEIGHFGHGLQHIVEHANHVTAKEKKSDDRDLMVAYVSKLVHDEMGKLTPAMLSEALEDVAGDE